MVRCSWSFSTEEGLFEYVGETWDSAIHTMLSLLPMGASYTLSEPNGVVLLSGTGDKIFFAHRIATDALSRVGSTE